MKYRAQKIDNNWFLTTGYSVVLRCVDEETARGLAQMANKGNKFNCMPSDDIEDYHKPELTREG